MSAGKISNAFRKLTEEAKGGVLCLTDKIDWKTVLDVLHEEHQEPRDANENNLVNNENPKSLPYHKSIFEELNASMIRKLCHENAWKPWLFRS